MKKILTLILVLLPCLTHAEVHLKSSWYQLGYMENGKAIPVKNQQQNSTITFYDDGNILINSLFIEGIDAASDGSETYITGYTSSQEVLVKIVWADNQTIRAIVLYYPSGTYITYMQIHE